jgi:hypothetical protein
MIQTNRLKITTLMAQKQVPCDFFNASLELLHFHPPYLLIFLPSHLTFLLMEILVVTIIHKPSLPRVALVGLTKGGEGWAGMQS